MISFGERLRLELFKETRSKRKYDSITERAERNGTDINMGRRIIRLGRGLHITRAAGRFGPVGLGCTIQRGQKRVCLQR